MRDSPARQHGWEFPWSPKPVADFAENEVAGVPGAVT
jgi:hypothetical protein